MDPLIFRDPAPPALARAVEGMDHKNNPITTDLRERWKAVLSRPS
ncbi:hypothetical protein [Nocardia brevicatena]|nr:hypothetical protein [Nocardia brevicatena]